jgi:hypothetical protein
MTSPTSTRDDDRHQDDMTSVQLVVSLLFWGLLLLAGVLYGAVSLAPKLLINAELDTRYRKVQSQLVGLEQRVTELRYITLALENDPRILQELARIDLDAASPDEERIHLPAELTLQSRVTDFRSNAPEVTRAWYLPILRAFAENERLRLTSLLSAAALVIIAFLFLHPSQATQVRSGWDSVSEFTSGVTGRYRQG